MTVPASRRPLLLLVAALGVQLLLLAFQIRRGHNIRLIHVWAVEAITPAASAGTTSIDWIHRLWTGYVDLHDARARNRDLQAQVNQLRLQVDRLRGRAAEADRLAALLSFRQTHATLTLLAARVIGASPAAATKLLYIDRGVGDGVRKDMAVITPAGVVGKILDVYRYSSQVLLITDRESGVGALLAGSRVEGVAKGEGGPDLLMDYVSNTEKVAPGQTILTSGLDQIFPKDLPVGTVRFSHAAYPFQRIVVRPAAGLDRIEDVLVVLRHPAPPKPAVAGDPRPKSRRSPPPPSR